MDAVEHVDRLIGIVNELTAILIEENEALARLQPRKTMASADRKAILTEAYAQHYEALRSDPAGLRHVPQGRKQQLASLTRHLDTLTIENTHLVRTVAILRQRLLNEVAAATRQAPPPLQRLAPDGTPGGRSPPLRAGSSLTLDQRL